jgi:hemolysin activation/secretion protein
MIRRIAVWKAPLVVVVVTVMLASHCLPALAQSAADIERAQQQAQQLIQQQQQQDQLRRQQDESRQRTPGGQQLAPQPAAPGTSGGPCTEVKSVVLDGADHLPPATRDTLIAPFLGRCLTLADINRLIADITNEYVRRGLVTSRVYVPEQKLDKGTLQLKVLEGRVEAIRLKNPGTASLDTAFPGVVGAVLQLRELEQATDQLNRLASNDAHIDIQPGSEPGLSVIELDNPVKRRWQASLGIDNSGQASTGYNTTSASLTADNPAGLNDYLNFSLHHSEAGEDSIRHSDGGSLYWNVPYGYWNFSAAYNAFHYGSVVSTATGTNFDTDGTSNSQVLKAERLVYRDQSIKWGVSGDLTLKETWNAIAGTRIVSSSADLTLIDLGSYLTWSRPGTLISASLGYTVGVDALGSTPDRADRPERAPRADYTKETYGASLLQLFSVGDLPLSFNSTLSGQFSRESLYGTEQFAIGSLYSVRGFRLDTLSGSSGVFVRNDLGVPVTLERLFGPGAGDGQIKPYIGLDYGRVAHVGELDGWSLGVDTSYRWITLQLAYSQPINTPSFLPHEHGWLFARVNLTY